MEDNQVEILNK